MTDTQNEQQHFSQDAYKDMQKMEGFSHHVCFFLYCSGDVL